MAGDLTTAINAGRKRKLALKFYRPPSDPVIVNNVLKEDRDNLPNNVLLPQYGYFMQDIHYPGKTATFDANNARYGFSTIGRPDEGRTLEDGPPSYIVARDVPESNKPLSKKQKIDAVREGLYETAGGSFGKLREVIAQDEKHAPVSNGGDFDAEYVAKKVRPGKQVFNFQANVLHNLTDIYNAYNSNGNDTQALKKGLLQYMRPQAIKKLDFNQLRLNDVLQAYVTDNVDKYAEDFVNRRPTRTVSDKETKNLEIC